VTARSLDLVLPVLDGPVFFGGIVNLFWIAALACFVLLEKTIPIGHWIGRIAGVAFAVWGVVMLASAASSS
jgi:predicted metal-binding membrane protein